MWKYISLDLIELDWGRYLEEVFAIWGKYLEETFGIGIWRRYLGKVFGGGSMSFEKNRLDNNNQD